MGRDDEILQTLKNMDARLKAAEERALAAESALADLGRPKPIPPKPPSEKGKYHFLLGRDWKTFDSCNFQIAESRYMRRHPTERNPSLIEASFDKPARVVLPEGSKIDPGLIHESVTIQPLAPLIEGTKEKRGTAAGHFGIDDDEAEIINPTRVGDRAADRPV